MAAIRVTVWVRADVTLMSQLQFQLGLGLQLGLLSGLLLQAHIFRVVVGT